MIPGMPGMPGIGAAAGGADDAGNAAFAQGILAGAGLREISQVLGLSRKRNGQGGGAEPSSATSMAGQLGDIDKIMLLAKMQSTMQRPGGPGVPPMPGAVGAAPMGPGAMPPPVGAPPMAPPMGGPAPMAMRPPTVGMPMPPGAPMGPGAPPMLPPGAGPAAGPQMPAGGPMAMMMLQSMMRNSGGIV